MVPDSPRQPSGDDAASGRDDRTVAEFDDAKLYTVVRDAVKDALLDVVGTLLLVGVAFVLVVAGAQALLQSASLLPAAVGLLFVVVGLYVAAATLELVPPIREWV